MRFIGSSMRGSVGESALTEYGDKWEKIHYGEEERSSIPKTCYWERESKSEIR